MRSLWLNPSRTPVVVQLARFTDYPYYLEALEEAFYPEPLSTSVTVRWRRYGAFTRLFIPADDEEEAEEIEAFIDGVAARMRAGEDIPPLVVRGRAIEDGRHRAFAAESLGLERAPTVDLALEPRAE